MRCCPFVPWSICKLGDMTNICMEFHFKIEERIDELHGLGKIIPIEIPCLILSCHPA